MEKKVGRSKARLCSVMIFVQCLFFQVRSGDRHTWYRLKGCGNVERGFPVEVKGVNGEISPRGSCFAHTAHNELYMTSVGNELLAPLGPHMHVNIDIHASYRHTHLPCIHIRLSASLHMYIPYIHTLQT